jgi:hypothetical protein
MDKLGICSCCGGDVVMPDFGGGAYCEQCGAHVVGLARSERAGFVVETERPSSPHSRRAASEQRKSA